MPPPGIAKCCLVRLPASVFAALLLVGSIAQADDWPQWRGPLRNGILPESRPLAGQWPTKGLTKLWESEAIPSNDDGGHGSVVAAGGRVYGRWCGTPTCPPKPAGSTTLCSGNSAISRSPVGQDQRGEHGENAADARSQPHGRGAGQVPRRVAGKEPRFQEAANLRGLRATRFQRRGDAIPLEVYDRLLTVSKSALPMRRP